MRLGFVILAATLSQVHAQGYGLDSLEPIGPFLNGVFPQRTPGENGFPQPPALLSQTGAFTNLATLTPRAGLLSYAVNSPLWTDNSRKKRWIAVPNNGLADTAAEKIHFDPNNSWSFPVGTVFIKQFDLPVDGRDPARIRRVETRFMVRASNGEIYGVTYRWREDGSDAELLLDGLDEEIAVTSISGTPGLQRWSYPSREDCLSCHNATAGFVLGVRTHQLNGEHTYSRTGRTDNQLRTWNHLGLFSPALDEAAIPAYLKSVPVSDASASLERRVRSYLDANCSQCHQPDILTARFDARYTTPLESQGLVDGSVLYDLGIPDARVVAPQSIERSLLHRRMSSSGLHQMPPIGVNLVDEEAVDVVSEWILALDPVTGDGEENHLPVARNDEASTSEGVAVDIPVLSNDSDLDDDTLSVASWTQPGHGSLEWLGNGFARYTPGAGFTGPDLFTYIAVDAEGGTSNEAVVVIHVHSGTNAVAIAFLDRSSRLASPSSASGVGMAVVDMDQDGFDDIVHLHEGAKLRIDYQEPGAAGFTGYTVDSANAQLQWGMCVADADGDGYPEVLSGGYYDNIHVFWNGGSRGSFSRVDITNPRLFLQAANFVDMNGDGLLDVFACHDVGDNAKFRNTGSRSFVYDNSLIDTRTTPRSDNSGNYGSVWTDYDNDGDLDLYISKCKAGVADVRDPRRVNMFFRNNGNGTYTDVAPLLGMDFGEQSWAADFGDIDNDGHLDCFVSNHGAPSYLMRNHGDGTFTDITHASGISVRWSVIQNVFRDFNNDGWVDLLLVGEQHEMWLNDRDGTFTKAPNPFTALRVESCAVGDLNHDGFTDVYAGYALLYNTPQTSRPDKLFLAEPNGNGFLSVTLEGGNANKAAVGARLELHGPWGIQVREVRGGESYGVTHSMTQIFGLGNAVSLDKLRVRWPSGRIEEVFNPAPNQFLRLREGSAAPPVLSNPGPQASQTGEVVSLRVNASDPAGDPLTYEAMNLPPGLSMDASGLISGTLSSGSAGNYSVMVEVSDSWTTVSAIFTWNVRLPEAAPGVVLSTNSSVVFGPFQVTARFTSPVSGLTLNDFALVNGSGSQFSGSDGSYQFTVTPGVPGDVTVYLPDNVAFDDGGLGNVESNTLPVIYRQPATPPVIASFTAFPAGLAPGESSTLTWDIDDGGAALTGLEITPHVGSVLGQSQAVVTPAESVTYIITATNSEGSVSAETSVTVDLPLPDEDALANLVAPGSIAHGETVNVSIDYASTGNRELWVWLQDSNDGWRTAAQGNVRLSAGSGSHTFSLSIDVRSRVGDGYVWALRLLPPGWASAADALAEQYSLADVRAGTLPPDVDALGSVVLPEIVESPSNVTLEVPYSASERREIRIFLHDSQDEWFTIAQGNATVDPGSGTRTFTMPVLSGAREGDGYVWAVRLLPLGWTVADDALDADYGNATVQRNSGGAATQDILTRVDAPAVVAPATIVQVTVEYEATESRDLGIWLHDSTDNWRTIGHGLVKVQPGIGEQTFDLGIVGDARVGQGYIWAVRLLPEGRAAADEAVDAFYKDAAVEPNTVRLTNLAVLPAATARQSSVYGAVFGADLARDGNTDGDWRNGSVTHTEWGVDPWWEVDLGGIQPVDHLLIWNRTDCCGDRLASYHVFLSDVPFVSEDVNEVRNQPGVTHIAVSRAPFPTERIDAGRDARYVRVQLGGANYLSLAEVEVYAPLGTAPANGVTYAYYEGTWDRLPDFDALHPLRTGTLSTIDLTPRVRDDYFALRYRGCVIIPEDGAYTFTLRSDEGSRLEIGGTLIVDNDVQALGEVVERSSTVSLAPGIHPFELQYFEAEGGQLLELYWEGPGFARQRVPGSALAVNETGENLGFHHVGRRVPANDNADGDLLDLTAEYALGRNPYRASMEDVGLELQAEAGGSRLTVSYERPANHASIDYWLEVSGDLQAWTALRTPNVIESPAYGWERVRFEDVQNQPGVSRDRGFVRLRIRHRDWNHETETPILAWVETSFRSGYQTHGVSLNAPPVYASFIAGVDPVKGRLAMVSNGLLEAIETGAYYLEVMNGPYEGHRWAVDPGGITDQVVALDLVASENTLSALPDAGLLHSRVVIRRHRTLGEIYPASQFHGSTDPSMADQLQFFNGSGYDGFFLLHGGGRHHWVAFGDSGLTDKSAVIIPPGVGNFVKRSADLDDIRVLLMGLLREHDFVQPLHPGGHLLAPAAPFPASPASRGLTWNHGFSGNTDPAQADQIWLWLGDGIEGTQSYGSYFLLDAGEPALRYWTGNEDEGLDNEDETTLFSGDRAFFFQAVGHGHPTYRIPGPEVR